MQYKDNLKDHKFALLGQNLLIHPLKAIYWTEAKMLILADLHIGKATHFRKSGIPIPENVHQNDFNNLKILTDYYKPERLVFLGDLFHSEWNQSWNGFRSFITDEIGIKPELVAGNHDILEKDHYKFMHLHTNTLICEPFIFSHKPIDQAASAHYYNLSGHLHPGIVLGGVAKQNERIPCFYFGKKNGILPAFGNFTGTSRIMRMHAEDQILAIADNIIIPIS